MSHQPLPYMPSPRHTTPAEAAAETMASGKLVSDELVAAMLESYLRTNDVQSWVLDGFPRNAHQAEMLASNPQTRPDAVIELVVEHADIRARLLQRRVDPATGAVYNLSSTIPDDAIRARLQRRADDRADVIERRLRVYEECMPGVRAAFAARGVRVVEVVGARGASVEQVWAQVRKAARGRRVVIAGAPGCGKGTQGKRLASLIGGEHVSTGDLLRKAARLASEEGLAAGVVERSRGGVVARL